MKLTQFHKPSLGKRLGIVTRDDEVIDVTSEESPGLLELLQLSELERVSIGVILADIRERISVTEAPSFLPGHREPNHPKMFDFDHSHGTDRTHFLPPINPSSQWNYEDENIFREILEPINHLGHNGKINLDRQSLPMPELGAVIDGRREIIGYTISIRTKTQQVIGQTFTTVSEFDDLHELEFRSTVMRETSELFSSKTTVSAIVCSNDEISKFIESEEKLPIGTLISMGKNSVIPQELELSDGDQILIEVDKLGKLSCSIGME